MEGQQFKAGADINTSVFVKITADDTVETAGAGEHAQGIMHESAWYTPIPGADADIAVIAGQSKRVYQEDEVCQVRVGAGAVAAGDKLTPDANGAAAVAGTAAEYSAICLRGSAANGHAKVIVQHGTTAHA